MEARRSSEESATCWLIARGFGAKGESPRGQRGGPGGDQGAARWCQGAVPAPNSHLWLDAGYKSEEKWTCVGSVDCFRLRTVRGEENIATNEPDLPAGVSPRSYPAC